MQEQVTDISKTLKELANQLKLICQITDYQKSNTLYFNRTVQAHAKETRALKKENSELHVRLFKYEQPPKDSNQSFCTI